MDMKRFVLFWALLQVFLLGITALADEVVRDEWQIVHFNDQPIGYVHTYVRGFSQEGNLVIESKVRSELRLSRFGQEMQISSNAYTLEDSEGMILRFDSETVAQGIKTSTRGVLEGSVLKIIRTIGGRDSEMEVDVSGCVGPFAAFMKLKMGGLKEGMVLKYRNFAPELLKVSSVEVKVLGKEKTRLLGSEEELWKVESKIEVLGFPVTEWMDDDFKVRKTFTPILGGMTTYSVDKETALAVMEQGEIPDVLAGSVIRSSLLIPHPYATNLVWYKISSTAEHADPELFELTGQRILKREGNAIRLEVKALNPDGDPDVELPIEEPGVEEEYLKANQYIESDDPVLRSRAREIVGRESNAYAAAKKLEGWVNEKMIGSLSAGAFNTARETLDLLEGDCTEHAVLLAGLLRAVGIPARVAVGVVYLDGGFYGHMWTEAYVGGWIGLDATLAAPKIDAARIKMTESSLADISVNEAFLGVVRLLGNITLEVENFEVGSWGRTVSGQDHSGGIEVDRYSDLLFKFEVRIPEGWKAELLKGEEMLGGHLMRMVKGDAVISIRAVSPHPSFDLNSLMMGLRMSGRGKNAKIERLSGCKSIRVAFKEEDELRRVCLIKDGDTLIIISSKGLPEDDTTFEKAVDSFAKRK